MTQTRQLITEFQTGDVHSCTASAPMLQRGARHTSCILFGRTSVGGFLAAPHRLTSSRTTPSVTDKDDELDAARAWLAKFDPESIPKSICEVSFSRSSGPGGQNVNKVNSKATLRLPLSCLLPLIPNVLHPSIRSSRFLATRSDAIVIQSDDSRKQGDNVQHCFRKLHNLVLDAAKSAIPGETSQATKQRIKGLQKADNEARLRMKKTHSSKKAARRGGRSSVD